MHSGSGTILRYTISLCAILGEEVRVKNIRAKREKSGLRPQHLQAVLACKELTGGEVEGAEVGAEEILFRPGPYIKGGEYRFDIGTAGSTTMLFLTLLPLGCLSKKSTHLLLQGGLFQDFAPSAFHSQYVLLEVLSKMGVEAEIRVERPGYVPKGGGILDVRISPLKGRIRPIKMLERGEIEEIDGVALSSHLRPQEVSDRMAKRFETLLKGHRVRIERRYDNTAIGKGAVLFARALTADGGIFGMDRAGRIGRSSEEIAKYVAENLLEDIRSGATVDRFLADQLIIFSALADGVSEYKVPKITDHIESNLWLVEEILGAKTTICGNHLKIEGIGFP
jgi:RNA 3'-terminal phosphate cyclase (ATP)